MSQKKFFFSGPATKRGGGKVPATKEKRVFFIYFNILGQKLWKKNFIVKIRFRVF